MTTKLPSPDQQATASPSRKRGILTLSGVAVIAIAASGAYTFTAHSTAAAVIESPKKVLDQAKTSTHKLNAALAPIAGELDDLTIKKLTDAVSALGEKSNHVHDSRGQWEAEQDANNLPKQPPGLGNQFTHRS